MDLAELVARSARGATRVGAIAIVGTAKNVGKTVTMNYLSHELSARGFSVGLVSSGRDGETTDSFTGEPKPSVVPPEGSWVATAEGVLGESGSLMEIADISERPGLLGRLVLGKVREPSPIELVGPGNVKELGAVVRSLRSLGADIVLVDGALDRVAAANPRVTDAAILATGASSGANLSAIADRLGFVVWLWSRPSPPDPTVRKLAREALEAGRVSFIYRTQSQRLQVTPFVSCLGLEEEILSLAGGADFVVVPGAVTQKFLTDSRSWTEGRDFSVVTQSAVNVFATEDPGVPIFAVDEMRVLAATVNPVSQKGISYEPADLVRAVAAGIHRASGIRLPVFDIVSGESSEGGVTGMVVG